MQVEPDGFMCFFRSRYLQNKENTQGALAIKNCTLQLAILQFKAVHCFVRIIRYGNTIVLPKARTIQNYWLS